MNHLNGPPHMPQNFRNQPPRRQNDYHYPNQSHHHHHQHQHHHHQHHVGLANPGPPPQPHHLSYRAYPYPPQYHAIPIQQPPQQWYQPYQHYPAPPPPHPPQVPLARQYHPLPHPPPPPPLSQQPQPQFQQHSQSSLPQQPPLIVSSHPLSQALPPTFNRQPPAPALTPQPDNSTPSTTSQNVISPSTTPTTHSVVASTSSVGASKTPPAATVTATSPPASPPTAAVPTPAKRIPYYPELPWLSVPDETFPHKTRRRRRRKPSAIPAQIELPLRPQEDVHLLPTDEEPSTAPISPIPPVADAETEMETVSASSTTFDTSSTGQTTPSALPQPTVASAQPAQTHKRTTTKPVVPVVPILPINRSTPKSNVTPPLPQPSPPDESCDPKVEEVAPPTYEPTPTASPPLPAKVAPKSWAELLRTRVPATNGIGSSSTTTTSGSAVINGTTITSASSLADVLRLYHVGNEGKVSFIEPRGLVNTGNVCYMNSILQTLVFCIPFYDFLDQISKRMVHNFKSETPLIEAMIMFMREYPVIDSTYSVEQLRMRLKDNELEQYGEPFIPEYVYEVIKRLPRFSTMRRGHQQDAEEFLGFLLEGLHDECVHVMKGPSSDSKPQDTFGNGASSPADRPESSPSIGNGWMEVGPKQKAAVTRSSGSINIESPITKIFGGKLRSVLRVPGLKDSVMLEPYQSLQIDIGAPNVSNITDALKGLTRSETLQGEFNSPRGPGALATRQIFVETLPPVLILHLKRFHYDSAVGTTQKIWKKVGYPLDLEIPKEVFPQSQRAGLTIRPGGFPKYRLMGVVYHHGKNASGGHYTVDIRRQEGREWIRIDDTVIRRVRTEDVAAEGGEEDPKLLAKALEQHKRDQEADKDSLFKQTGFVGLNSEQNMDDDDDEEDGKGGWSQVNGYSIASPTTSTASGKKWSSIANGDVTPKSGEPLSGKQTPRGGAGSKFSAKDNKVAYILFYQQIHP